MTRVLHLLFQLLMCGLALLCTARPAEARTEVVVVAALEYGPTVTHFFQAVVQARLPEVEIRFVPEDSFGAQSVKKHTELIFHLDTSDARKWKLRLVHRGRAWRHTVEGGLEQDKAAVEAAALIAARTSVALLTAGEEDPSTPVPDELSAWAMEPAPARPEASPPSKESEPLRRKREPARTAPVTQPVKAREDSLEASRAGYRADLRMGYRGSNYASEPLWTHGILLALAGELPSGFCGRAGYAWLADARVDTEFGSFDVARHQAEGLAGYCVPFGGSTFALRLGGLWELARRSSTSPDVGVGIGSARAASSWAAVASLDVSYSPLRHVAAFASINALGLLNKAQFVAEGLGEPLLDPHRFRLGLDVGVLAHLP